MKLTIKLKKGIKIDYSDPIRRFAYIYKYVTSHANYVYQLLNKNQLKIDVLSKTNLKVTSLGGGPGSDFLGLIKYLLELDIKPKYFKCFLLDKEKSWSEAWDDVDEKLSVDFQLSTTFKNIDATDQSTWQTMTKSFQSDLYTFVYFMSEVYAIQDSVNPFFDYVLDQIDRGAYILYIDNKDSDFSGWFDSLMKKHNFEVVHSEEKIIRITDYSEEKKDLGEYFKTFGSPKLESDVAIRICKKK